jgi:hypothetical protein
VAFGLNELGGIMIKADLGAGASYQNTLEFPFVVIDLPDRGVIFSLGLFRQPVVQNLS